MEAGIDEAVVADSCDARNIDSASPIQLDAERRVSQVVDEVRRSAAQARRSGVIIGFFTVAPQLDFGQFG